MQEKDALQEKVQKIERHISEQEKVFDGRKWKRTKQTLLVLSAAIYLIAFVNDTMNHWQDFLKWILIAPVMAGLLMVASFVIVGYMMIKSLEEEKYLARMRGQIDAINFMNDTQ